MRPNSRPAESEIFGEHSFARCTDTATVRRSSGWRGLFTNKGRAFPFGNAGSHGDMSGAHLNGPIVASVATPSGHGYYMVGSDGGIFDFSNKPFFGSLAGNPPSAPIIGLAAFAS